MSHPMEDLERMEDALDRMSADNGDRLSLAPTDSHYRALADHIPETRERIRILDLGSGLGYRLGTGPGAAHAQAVRPVTCTRTRLPRPLELEALAPEDGRRHALR